ncbi:MAG: transglutaminase-like domain-containing protein [Verrucomicrobiae bacterium]|nr:transglutaminase-like domain-containing protein [Verrucomicrobiae bacterium]
MDPRVLRARIARHFSAARTTKRQILLACAGLALTIAQVASGQPAASRASAGLYNKALKLEQAREFARAEEIYRDLLRRCQGETPWRLRRDAEQGLRRIEDMRSKFCWSEAQLREQLAKTYRGFQPSELAEWERRGWMLAWKIDGKKLYYNANVTNLQFFDTALMARNESAAQNFQKFVRIFLDESARLDRLRAESRAPEHYVDPVRFVFTAKVVVKQGDLPPGRLVRAWFPYPLLTPAVQNVRTLSVQPAGALKSCPDPEAQIGIAYLEVPRPEKDDLLIELKAGFDAYHTDFQIEPDAIPPYDTQSELYRRFTRSEPQIALTKPLRAMARSVVGRENNPYRQARLLYDWVCDHVKYNYVWCWRDATFTYGCASEEVRQRRIGDCVIQCLFYAALCRSVGIPARVHNGPIFPPGMRNDHVWAEVYFPRYGWMPVDVTYSEVAGMVPGLTDAERRAIRDFFFGRMDRWRFCTQRNDLAQELVPLKRSPRRRVTMFIPPELECDGRDVEKRTFTWDCRPVAAN